MDTKQKGNVGTSCALNWFVKNGYEVSIPFGDSAIYDMIIEKNGEFKTVQCKFTSVIHHGAFKAHCRHRSKSKKVAYIKNSVDLFFIMCSNGVAYLIPGKVVWGKRQTILSKKFDKYKLGE